MKVNELAKKHIIENHVLNAFLLKKIATGYKIVWISKSYISLFSLFADPIDRNEVSLNQLFSNKYLSYTNKQGFKTLLNSATDSGKSNEMAPFKIYKSHDLEHFQYFKPVNYPIKDDKNNYTYVLHKLIDITPESKEPKDQQSNLESELTTHKSFFLNHPNPLCIIDHNGLIQEVNTRWREYATNSEISENVHFIFDYFPAQLKSSMLNFLKQIGKTVKTFETKTDRINNLKLTFYPLANPDFSPKYIVEFQNSIPLSTENNTDDKEKMLVDLFMKVHQKINEGISPLKKINKTMDLICQSFEISGLWYSEFKGNNQSSPWILHQNKHIPIKKFDLSHKAAVIYKTLAPLIKPKPQKILVKNLDNKDLSDYLNGIGIVSIFHIPVFQNNIIIAQSMLFQINPENRIMSNDLFYIQMLLGLVAPLDSYK